MIAYHIIKPKNSLKKDKINFFLFYIYIYIYIYIYFIIQNCVLINWFVDYFSIKFFNRIYFRYKKSKFNFGSVKWQWNYLLRIYSYSSIDSDLLSLYFFFHLFCLCMVLYIISLKWFFNKKIFSIFILHIIIFKVFQNNEIKLIRDFKKLRYFLYIF